MEGKRKQKNLFIYGLVAFITVVGFAILIAGIVQTQKKTPCTLASSATTRDSTNSSATTGVSSNSSATTEDSTKLINFMKKVQKSYYRLNANNYVYMPDVDKTRIKEEFRPYDPSPMAIKRQTDTALALLAEINGMNLNMKKLRPRERKAVAQVKHFLQSIFGQPYEANYYAGDWLLGPNYFCWQPICYIGYDLNSHLQPKVFQPKTKKDLEFIVSSLKQHGQAIDQYVKNIQSGVKAGFVRSVEDCESGTYSIISKFPQVSRKNETGIFDEKFIKGSLKSTGYFSKLDQNVIDDWRKEQKKSVEESMNENILRHLGKPLARFINYLKYNHSIHCTPSQNSSGWASLPLDYVWVKQKPDYSQPTTKKLPTGEPLDGKKAYEKILPYFTTNQMTPDEIYNLGKTQLDKLYPQAIEIAQKITNINDEKAAAITFKTKWLDSTEMFFNSTPIPVNESSKDGFDKCVSMETARLYCPVRYKAMVDWFKYVETILSTLYPKTRHMFYYTGERATTPNCPVKLVAKFNPSSGSQSYGGAGASCSRPSYYYLPFYLTPPGPKYNAMSVAGHEARPGHHTQVQGFYEHFSTSASGDAIDWLNKETYYTAFTEGWALYAENPLLAQETDIYKNNLIQKYGMLKWQIWRALRLIMDTGFHYKGMKREEARKLFEDKAWDTTEKSTKDLTRYQSDPGQATAYMIGQLSIWKMRNYTEQKLKEKGIPFNAQEFHYHILSQGSSPLDYLNTYIKEYVECKINSKNPDCRELLNPKSKKTTSESKSNRINEDEWPVKFRPHMEHYD